ncbi:MAG: hypothetical protein K1X88_18795 [Nannocystaceae bacterium]|nr:hypothetical protein [Nannocystaceae bacterium]
MAGGNISYHPTEGLTYDPSDPHYWDEDALQAEITRVFEVCHGCRMCFKYCDSFPILFKALDEECDGDVRRLPQLRTDEVMRACFQCKLCEVQCPYTPRDQHPFQLDFPKLVHRYTAIQKRKRKPSLQDFALRDPDVAGLAARASLGAVDALNRNKLHRWFQEKVLGIHRDKLLPPFADHSFERWAVAQGLCAPERGKEAVLFQTCYVQHNEPAIGQDAIYVLQRNQVDVRCEKGLQCCGMPAWERGDLELVRDKAKHNLDRLLPRVEQGAKVIALNPTCSMMMRREWPELVGGDDRARARTLAAAVVDSGEFLWSIRNEPRFCSEFRSSPGGKVAYHAPCHLRAQGVGFRGRDLLRRLPGVQPVTVMECCGHDGTHAMKVEGFEASRRIGRKAFEGMDEAATEVWATDCPLAAIQFQQHAGRKPMHPMSILARALRGDPFPGAATKPQGTTP